MNTVQILSDVANANPADQTAQLALVDAVTEAVGDGQLAAGHVGYYPEMGDKRPAAQMEARLSHYGKHYFVDTPLELKVGRGCKFLGKFPASPGARKEGWNQYKVTVNEFEKLQKTYRISSEILL